LAEARGIVSDARAVLRELRAAGDPDVARGNQRFFKTAPGQYGAGDRFLGIRLPDLRRLTKAHQTLPLAEVRQLLRSPYHEARLLAVLILVRQYERGNVKQRTAVFRTYLSNLSFINNWDLVDVSASQIVGAHLRDADRSLLYKLAESRILWRRRIAIIATFGWIRKGDVADTLALAEILLHDKEDLIHKAVGWMLREVGKRDTAALRGFLSRRHHEMPRTMLRYAIERFPEPERQHWLRTRTNSQ
jgi:3-methyladenine DNA glycosylase AlkD